MVSQFALSNLLLASAALAAPSSQQGAHLARRQENHQSQPVNNVASSARAAIDRNPSWAGAVVSTEVDKTFTTVTGTFIVPTLTGGDGNSTGGLSIQVGMDAYTCPRGFQVGINAAIINGVSSYSAWYDSELIIDRVFNITNIPIHANDVLTVSIDTRPADSSLAVIENHTTSQNVTLTFDYVPECRTDVVWFVGVHKGNTTFSLADFGEVIFTNATAHVNGTDYNPLGATTILDIVQIGKILTYVATAKDSLLVQYLSGR